jgi:hypothetical protein
MYSRETVVKQPKKQLISTYTLEMLRRPILQLISNVDFLFFRK